MGVTYCITGVSGYIGGLLARRLAAAPSSRVIGIDLKPPPELGRMRFHQRDIRDPDLGKLLAREKVDVVVHLAFYTQPEGDAAEARSVNIDGTRNILAAVAVAKARRFVLASSAAAYGSHPDNPVPMHESTPLRANDFFYYSAHKARQEALTNAFIAEHPETAAVILRPCVVIGPHITNPTGEALRQKLLIFIRGAQPPLQMIDEDDVVEAFYLAATGDGTGVFNVAGKGTLTYPELARIMNKPILLLPFGLLSALASLGKRLHLSPVSATTLRFIRHPIVIDGARFARQFGFRPKYAARQAFKRFAGVP